MPGRQQTLNSMLTQDYLRTKSAWKKRRLSFLELHPTCFCCDVRPPDVPYLCVHHRTYIRLGNELDRDLVTLCLDCHVETHRLAERGVALYHAHFRVRDLVRSGQPVGTNNPSPSTLANRRSRYRNHKTPAHAQLPA